MSHEKILETLVKKVDGLADDVRTNSYKLDRLENGLDRVGEKVNKVEEKVDKLEGKVDRLDEKLDGVSSDLKILSGQFNDVGGMAIKDNGRISDLENRVDVLEAGVN